jgi:hypothetical protein
MGKTKGNGILVSGLPREDKEPLVMTATATMNGNGKSWLTDLPDKKILENKLNELIWLVQNNNEKNG